jgi:hypothetical protein
VIKKTSVDVEDRTKEDGYYWAAGFNKTESLEQ